MIAVIADQFHVTPFQAARDLDDDPERLSIICTQMLRYAEAKRAFDSAKKADDLKPWRDSLAMREVERNTFTLHHERSHPGLDVPECKTCERIREEKRG